MTKTKEIGLVGGTFNPIHTRVLMVAQYAMEQFGLEEVTFMPNGSPPHKHDILDRHLRLEMVQAAVRGNPRFKVSRLEVDRPGTTWTIDTLKELTAALGPAVRINWICGQDVVESLEGYERTAELLSYCRLLVAPRKGLSRARVRRWRDWLPEGAGIEIIDCPANSMSSTIIRDWVRRGKSIKYVVPEPVRRIIERRGHYRQCGASSAARAA